MRKETIGDCTLYLGDCLEIMPTLGKVDAVVTDPPYPKEFLPLWKGLAETSPAVLKDNGILIALSGHGFLDQVMGYLNDNLNYLWCGCYLCPGNNTPYWPLGISTGWKPLLFYSNGTHKFPHWQYDVISVSGEYAKDSHYHHWGQNVPAFRTILQRFTKEKQLILDPFMGGGTTAVACIEMGRNFIGIEKEEKHFDIACERISRAERQGDLFRKPTAEQIALV